MQKQFFSCLSGIIPAIALFTNLNAQATKSRFQLNVKEFISHEAKAQLVATNEGNTVNINTRALKDFTKSFKNAGNAGWRQISDGFVAEFETNGVKTKVYYNRKGYWCSTLLTYDQYKLPKEIRKLVRTTYYDYEIYLVHEVTVLDKTIYLVKIQDQETIKTIRITDGEMDVYEDYKKN